MAASRFNPTSAARAGVDHWLALCLACTLLWGVWAFLSKVLADRVGAIETQLLFTLGMLVASRFIAHVPIPGADLNALQRVFQTNQLAGFFDLFSGGALSRTTRTEPTTAPPASAS